MYSLNQGTLPFKKYRGLITRVSYIIGETFSILGILRKSGLNSNIISCYIIVKR